MLDMGFYDDIIKIVNKLLKKTNFTFSAAMPNTIRKLAKVFYFNLKRLALLFQNQLVELSNQHILHMTNKK